MNRILLFCLLALTCAAPSLTHASATPFKVQVTGTGPRTVVLLPGYSCSGDVWRETVAQLAPAYRCHVLTMPGFAGTKPETDPKLAGWVEALAAYIRAEHLDKPVVIGHSLGGGMALWLAADHPELVSKVVVVDALPCLAALQNPAFKPDAAPDCGAFAARFQGLDDAQLFQMQKQAAAQLTTDTARARQVARWGAASDRATLGQAYCQFINTDLRPQLARIQCPTLVLLEAPFQAMAATVAGQYQALRGAQLAYATRGLHFVMYDDPQWYAGQLRGFLL